MILSPRGSSCPVNWWEDTTIRSQQCTVGLLPHRSREGGPAVRHEVEGRVARALDRNSIFHVTHDNVQVERVERIERRRSRTDPVPGRPRIATSGLARFVGWNKAADATTTESSTCVLMDLAAKMPSSHDVSMLLLLKSSVSSQTVRGTRPTARISPRTFELLKSSVAKHHCGSRRAPSALSRFAYRSSPVANRWPNCESANSWTPPFAPTEK